MDSDGQYSDLCCSICYSYFSEKSHIPHMLKCGHTYCNQCLASLLRTGSEKCGECRKTIGYKSVKSIPVNYSVLRLIESFQNKNAKHSEFCEIEDKIDNMINMLDKNKKLYETRISENALKVEEVVKEKKRLKEVKQSLLKDSVELEKSKTLNRSLSTIKNTMEKMKQIDEQFLVIESRMKKGQNLNQFQSLLDSPRDFAIKKDDDHLSTCFVLGGKIYVSSYSSFSRIGMQTIDVSLLQPHLVGAFMIVEYIGRSVLLEFSLFSSNWPKQFMDKCMAEKGSNFEGASFLNYSRPNLEGESVTVGFAQTLSENNPSKSKKQAKKELALAKAKSESTEKCIRKGFLEVLGKSDPKVKGFKIYLEGWPCRSSNLCFGKLTRGSSIVKAILKNKFEAKVTKCGLFYDPLTII